MDGKHCRTKREFSFTQEQYDKIYRYCYFKLHNRELAEDVTQEAFLRYWDRYRLLSQEAALKCLYRIAGNLCIDEYRRSALLSVENAGRNAFETDRGERALSFPGENGGSCSGEERLLNALVLRDALRELEEEEQELLLLRYVNEVPVGAIAGLFGISRFALRRRLLTAREKLKSKLREEDFS